MSAPTGRSLAYSSLLHADASLPGGVPGQDLAIEAAPLGAVPLPRALGHEDLAGNGVLEPGRFHGTHEGEHVVDHVPPVRPHLRPHDPLVLVEVRRNDQVLVVDRALRLDEERLGHLEHQVGLADVPSVDELQRLGSVLRIAARGSGLDPLGQRALLLGTEHVGVREVPVARIGEPRRHAVERDSLPDRPRPRPDLLVGQQRHRGRLARAMAVLTVLLQDGLDVRRGRSAGSR